MHSPLNATGSLVRTFLAASWLATAVSAGAQSATILMDGRFDDWTPSLSPVFGSRRNASEAVTGDPNVTQPSIHRPRIHPHFQQPFVRCPAC